MRVAKTVWLGVSGILLVLVAGVIGQFGSIALLPSVTSLVGMTSEEAARITKDYYVIVKGSGPIYGLPGKTYALEFEINNLGELADTYDVTTDSTNSWVDFSAIPSSLQLGSRDTRAFHVSLTIPGTARMGETMIYSVAARSTANPMIWDVSSVELVVGE